MHGFRSHGWTAATSSPLFFWNTGIGVKIDQIPCRDLPILIQFSILIAQNVDLVKTSIYTGFFSFFLLSIFAHRCLFAHMCAICFVQLRTGAVSLSTGHRHAESQSHVTVLARLLCPLPSGPMAWLTQMRSPGPDCSSLKCRSPSPGCRTTHCALLPSHIHHI